MASRRRTEPEPTQTPHRRATTPEGRENQLIALAENLAEQQLRSGTASAQVISHYLKLGSTREQLEQQRLQAEVELQKAKVQALAASGRLEELVTDALEAFKSYAGRKTEEDEFYHED